MVVENWFNLGGSLQLVHDVKRNLVPAFAPPNKVASQLNQLPRYLSPYILNKLLPYLE